MTSPFDIWVFKLAIFCLFWSVNCCRVLRQFEKLQDQALYWWTQTNNFIMFFTSSTAKKAAVDQHRLTCARQISERARNKQVLTMSQELLQAHLSKTIRSFERGGYSAESRAQHAEAEKDHLFGPNHKSKFTQEKHGSSPLCACASLEIKTLPMVAKTGPSSPLSGFQCP